MSIFGSRDDDPLLQGDPFAPDAEDDPSDGEPPEESTGEDANDEGPRPEGPSMTERPDAPPAEADSDRRESVFGPADNAEGHPSDRDAPGSEEGGTRVLVRLLEEAANGRLDRLNTAVEAGWRLQRVELVNETPDEQRRSAGASRSLAFVLHKPNS